MLDRLIRTLVPDRLLKQADEKQEHTDAVIDESLKARRMAEAQMIQSYRKAGAAVERHPWRN
jgi:hypothetical protein